MRRLWLAILVLGLATPLLATEPNPSPRQRQLVEKLMTVMRLDASMRNTIDAMYAQIEKQFIDSSKADPDDVAEAREMFASFRKKAAKVDFGADLHEAFVRIYAKYYTEQELTDLITFYGSSTGQKSLDLMPQLLAEGMQAGAQHISPKIEALMREAMDEMEQKRPWRRTMKDIRTVATALEAYSLDHDDLYPSSDYESLKALLSPTYVETFPENDMWGHGYAYVVSADHKHYRLVSAGADTNFEWDSRRIVPVKEGEEPEVNYRERLEDDLIYADGAFVQLPVQAKPKPAKKN